MTWNELNRYVRSELMLKRFHEGDIFNFNASSAFIITFCYRYNDRESIVFGPNFQNEDFFLDLHIMRFPESKNHIFIEMTDLIPCQRGSMIEMHSLGTLFLKTKNVLLE